MHRTAAQGEEILKGEPLGKRRQVLPRYEPLIDAITPCKLPGLLPDRHLPGAGHGVAALLPVAEEHALGRPLFIRAGLHPHLLHLARRLVKHVLDVDGHLGVGRALREHGIPPLLNALLHQDFGKGIIQRRQPGDALNPFCELGDTPPDGGLRHLPRRRVKSFGECLADIAARDLVRPPEDNAQHLACEQLAGRFKRAVGVAPRAGVVVIRALLIYLACVGVNIRLQQLGGLIIPGHSPPKHPRTYHRGGLNPRRRQSCRSRNAGGQTATDQERVAVAQRGQALSRQHPRLLKKPAGLPRQLLAQGKLLLRHFHNLRPRRGARLRRRVDRLCAGAGVQRGLGGVVLVHQIDNLLGNGGVLLRAGHVLDLFEGAQVGARYARHPCSDLRYDISRVPDLQLLSGRDAGDGGGVAPADRPTRMGELIKRRFQPEPLHIAFRRHAVDLIGVAAFRQLHQRGVAGEVQGVGQAPRHDGVFGGHAVIGRPFLDALVLLRVGQLRPKGGEGTSGSRRGLINKCHPLKVGKWIARGFDQFHALKPLKKIVHVSLLENGDAVLPLQRRPVFRGVRHSCRPPVNRNNKLSFVKLRFDLWRLPRGRGPCGGAGLLPDRQNLVQERLGLCAECHLLRVRGQSLLLGVFHFRVVVVQNSAQLRDGCGEIHLRRRDLKHFPDLILQLLKLHRPLCALVLDRQRGIALDARNLLRELIFELLKLIRLHVLVHGDIHSGVVGVPCLIHLDELADTFFAIEGMRHREKRHGVYFLPFFAHLPLLIDRDDIVPEAFRSAAHPDNAARITIRHAVGLIYPAQRGGRGDTIQRRRNETRPERTLAKLGQCRAPRLILIKLR